MILIRSLLIGALTCAAVLPYCAADWLVRHDAIYYRLSSAGRLGRSLTDTAEVINFLSPIPFVILGLVVGITLAFTLRCFSIAATVKHG